MSSGGPLCQATFAARVNHQRRVCKAPTGVNSAAEPRQQTVETLYTRRGPGNTRVPQRRMALYIFDFWCIYCFNLLLYAARQEIRGQPMRTLLSLLLTIALCSATTAVAAPLTWQLDGVAFDDGITATGSFTYDAVNNVFSGGSISTGGGGGVPALSFNNLIPQFSGDGLHFAVFESRGTVGAEEVAQLQLIVPLASLVSPGPAGLLPFSSSFNAPSFRRWIDVGFAADSYSELTSGRLVLAGSAPMPIPSVLWLMLLFLPFLAHRTR